MAKYRRKLGPGKPFDAFKYDGNLMNSLGEYYVPYWAVEMYKQGVLFYEDGNLFVQFPISSEVVKPGDYVTLEGSIVSVFPGKSFERFYEEIKEES